MIRPVHLLAAMIGGVVAAATLSVPAEAATYSVTLNPIVAKADVGTAVQLSGRVTGKNAGKKRVLLQRKVGAGAWVTVATPKTSKSGAFSVAHRLAVAGTQSFRVVAPKKGKTKAGVSTTRTLVGWTWLKLYDESYLSTGGYIQRGWDADINGTVNGGRPPRDTFGLAPDSSIFLGWRVSNLCDQFRAEVGVADSTNATQHLRIEGANDEPAFEVVPSEIVNVQRSLMDTTFLRITRPSAGTEYVVVEAPRAHCSVPRLPISYD